MSKTISLVILAGIILVGGYLAISGKSKNTAMTEGEPANPAEVAAPAETGKKMAFSQFVKQGGSYQCEVKQSMSDMENSGTVFISGGNIRGEYTTIAEGRTMDTHFILKDGYSYTWSSLMPNTGFKVKVDASASAGAGAASGTYSRNAEQIGDYNCEAWTLDPSKFVLPADITFQEVGA